MENSQKGWTLLKQSVVYVQEIASLKSNFHEFPSSSDCIFRFFLPCVGCDVCPLIWGPLTAEYISWVDDVRPASGRNLVQVQVQSKAPWCPKGRSLRLLGCHSGGMWYGKSATTFTDYIHMTYEVTCIYFDLYLQIQALQMYISRASRTSC